MSFTSFMMFMNLSNAIFMGLRPDRDTPENWTRSYEIGEYIFSFYFILEITIRTLATDLRCYAGQYARHKLQKQNLYQKCTNVLKNISFTWLQFDFILALLIVVELVAGVTASTTVTESARAHSYFLS